jgi:hypothetical protein
MKDVEKYIKDNVELFNEEPATGHFNRFEQKLKVNKGHKRRTMLRSTMRIASIVALLVVSGLYLNERLSSEEEVVYVNVEFEQAQHYYKTQISNGISAIESFDKVLNDEQRTMLVEEMSEADTLFEQLQVDLAARPDDPRVIEAMLNHYRMKAAVLNKIVNDLERINNTQKINHHENAQI